jgi:hypothetical protein
MTGSSPRRSIGAVVLVYDEEYETGLGHEYEESGNRERYVGGPRFRWTIINGRSLRGSRR